jgi:hypothetical protein
LWYYGDVAEKYIKNRVKFPTGFQRIYLEKIISLFSVEKIAIWCNKSERTIRDWRREKFLIDEESLNILVKKSKVLYPNSVKIIDTFWYTKKGSMLGWKAVIKKYGKFPKDEKKRKEKWYEWWEKKGKFSKNRIGKRKRINVPRKSKKLSEFVGIMIGDGSITKSQIQISMSSVVDKEYSDHVKTLIEELFNVSPSIINIPCSNVIKIIVSRKNLVDYCKKIGLKEGNKLKNHLSIPFWIKNNTAYKKSCLRGIMDTDGCIFSECHKYKNKIYKYKRWNITSASPYLRKDISDILNDLDFSPKIRNNRCVQLENNTEIKKYFEKIGSNNPKHINRYFK